MTSIRNRPENLRLKDQIKLLDDRIELMEMKEDLSQNKSMSLLASMTLSKKFSDVNSLIESITHESALGLAD